MHYPGWISEPQSAVLALSLAAVIVVGVMIGRYLRRGPSPEEIEKLRRRQLNALGKLGDGEVNDVEGVAIIYSYAVGGVGYSASQDVSSLESLLPENTMSLLGPAVVKFDPRNPANSIVLCEEWSGLVGCGARRVKIGGDDFRKR